MEPNIFLPFRTFFRKAVADAGLLASGDFRGVSDCEVQDHQESADEVVQLSQGIQKMACSLKALWPPKERSGPPKQPRAEPRP